MRGQYLALLAILFIPFFGLNAQDTHYWTHQFGTRSALMSGAVVGGALDNTMIFYNPGALAFMKTTSVSVNANAYNIQLIRIKNALGNEADYLSNQTSSIPLLAGGLIRVKNEKVRVGYGILAPVDFSFKGIARVDGEFDVINEADSPGTEELVGESGISTDLRELAFLLSTSKVLNEHWAVGLTNIVQFRTHKFNRSLNSYIYPNNALIEVVGGNLTENVDYYNLRYVMKFGALYKKDAWSVGLTFTTPSINLFGRGTTAANIAARNLLFEGQDARISPVASDRQSDLKTRFKSPWSAAIGVNYRGERSGFGVAMEYFGAVDIYSIMEPEPNAFVRPEELAPQLESDRFLDTPSGAKPVLNMAVGYEYFLDEKWTLYASARNNGSNFDPEINQRSGIKTTISSWDIYHLTSGFTMRNKRTSISLGLLLSGGKNDRYEQLGNLAEITEDNLIRGSVTLTEASYFTAGVLFGFTFYFDRLEFSKE